MSRDPKSNKSPIESILQQSFSHISTNSVNNGPHHNYNEQMRQQSNRYHQQFRISNNQFNINSNNNVQLQQKLKLIQMATVLQLEIKVGAIAAVFANKVNNALYLPFQRIKHSELNTNPNIALRRSDRAIVIKRVNLFFQKINSIFQAKRLKNMGTCFLELNLNRSKHSLGDKSSSFVSPYKAPYKVDNSDRGDSEWELGDSQGYPDTNQHIVRQNRFLKKKKEKLRNNKEEFHSKMDQLLSMHEAFLSKR